MSKRNRKSWLQKLWPIILIGAVVCSCFCGSVGLIATGVLKLSTDDSQPTVVAKQTYTDSSAKSVGTEPEATKVKSVGSDSTVAVATPSPVVTVEKQPSAASQLGGKVFPTSTSASPATQEPTLKPFFDCRLLVKQDYPAPSEIAIAQDLDGTKDYDVVDPVTCQLTKVKKTEPGKNARVIGWFGTSKTEPEWLKIQVVEREIYISRRYVDGKWWAQYIPSRTPWPTLTPTVASGGQVAAAGGKVFPTNTVAVTVATVAMPTPTSQKAAVFSTAPINDCSKFKQINRVYPLTLELTQGIGSRDNPDVIDAGTCALTSLSPGTYVAKGWYGTSASEAWLMVQNGTKFFYIHPRFVPVTAAQNPAKPTNTPTVAPTRAPTATPAPPTAAAVVAAQNSGYTFRKLPSCPETLLYSGQAVKMSTNQPTSLAQGSYKVGGWWVIQDGKYIGVRAEYQGENYLILRGNLSVDIQGCAP